MRSLVFCRNRINISNDNEIWYATLSTAFSRALELGSYDGEEEPLIAVPQAQLGSAYNMRPL